MNGILSLFKSRKFILTLVPVITMVLNEMGYTDVSNEILIGLITSIGALVLAIAHEDNGKVIVLDEKK